MTYWDNSLSHWGDMAFLPELAYISICFHRPHYVEHFKGYKDVIHQTEGSIYKTDGLWTKPGAWSVQQFLLNFTFLCGSISHFPPKALSVSKSHDVCWGWRLEEFFKRSSSKESSVEGLPIPICSTRDHFRKLPFNCSSSCKDGLTRCLSVI